MKTKTINNLAGELTLRKKSIPIFEWRLTTQIHKLRRKKYKNDFLISQPPTTSGTAIVSSAPIRGKIYRAIFTIRKRNLKIFAKIWITEIEMEYPWRRPVKIKIYFETIGPVTTSTNKIKNVK
jgi:hypothetical protein